MSYLPALFMRKRFWGTVVILGLVGLLAAFRSTTVQVIVENLTPPDLPPAIVAETRVVLDQNWDPQMTERFHFISQGTGTLPIPYHWLLALEQPESSPWRLLWPDPKPAFVAPDYISRYGFIPAPVSTHNPDGLPVGFAKTPSQNLVGYSGMTTAVGFTCAACHTGRFTHDRTEYIVNGGPAVTDLQGLTKGLGAALGQTLFTSKLPLPNKRFDRFAQKVLGKTYSKTAKAALAKDLDAILTATAATADRIDVTEGFGRLDALNRIGNQVFSKNTHQPENYVAINAPVNFPHIWTASWFDWVQYDGSIMQPLVRNAGEAMGVHANVDTVATRGRFSSSVPVANLKWIEDALAGDTPPMQAKRFGGLHGPAWPAALGAIDPALAARGASLYQQHCQGCHLPPVTTDAIFDDRFFKPISYEHKGRPTQTREAFLALNIIGQDIIGTDPAQGAILATRTVNTAGDPATGQDALGLDTTVCVPRPALTGSNPASARTGIDTTVSKRTNRAENILVETEIRDGPMLGFALALGAIVQQVDESWFNRNAIPDGLRRYFEGERPNCLQSGAGYKARPLNGVWATAPFLHNGSVPTLDDLLRPAHQRPRFVRLGAVEFDPVKVGLKQPELRNPDYPAYQDGYFILDTALAGNRNTGHSFGGDGRGVIGPELSESDRQALIEYLKTL